jgi:hypothetical protein
MESAWIMPNENPYMLFYERLHKLEVNQYPNKGYQENSPLIRFLAFHKNCIHRSDQALQDQESEAS